MLVNDFQYIMKFKVGIDQSKYLYHTKQSLRTLSSKLNDHDQNDIYSAGFAAMFFCKNHRDRLQMLDILLIKFTSSLSNVSIGIISVCRAVVRCSRDSIPLDYSAAIFQQSWPQALHQRRRYSF